MGLLAPIRDYVDTLVHPAAQQDILAAAPRRTFMAPRLVGIVFALAVLPAYVALHGSKSVLEAIILGGLGASILTVSAWSRIERYGSTHVLSWLASTLALGAAGFLLLMGALDLLPQVMTAAQERGALAVIGILSAALYANGLALGAQSRRRRMRSRLRSAEEDRYRLLARNMTDVIAHHGCNGALLFASPAAEPLFGAKVADLLGHGLFDRVHVADRPAFLSALAGSVSRGDSRSVEFRVRRDAPDGLARSAFIWIEMRCQPLEQALGEDGPARDREVVAVMREITSRKEHERAIEAARAEAERANAAKSRFLATMSHELRTPLNAIIGFSEMLSNEGVLMIDAKRRHDYAHLISESGHHLLSVVNGLLDMSKIETGNFEITPEPLSPEHVIEDCCQLLALKARGAGIEIVTRLPGNLREIVADKRSLSQIMINLMSNAIKFTGQGGTITVSAQAEGNAIAVTVEDNGVGIDAEDLARVGDAFFQARSSYDRRRDGTGLGLSIVKGLLALHGGDMEIASRLGEGTCVTIRLPVDCEAARQGREPGSVGRVAPCPPVADEPSEERVKLSA